MSFPVAMIYLQLCFFASF